MKPQILLVDDDADLRFGFFRYLTKAGYDVTEAESLSAATEAISATRFDAILLDLNLPDGNTLSWIPELRGQCPNLSLIVITGEGDLEIGMEALRKGADHYLTKPVSMLDLDLFLQKSMELGGLRRVESVRRRQAEREECFAGKSNAVKKVQELATLAAENDSTVLLLGETGTGKGVLAKWIHSHSAIQAAPFVEVNCSALRGELLASELFGHRRGAFTSAVEDSPGLLEVADGGTLFLDEIGDMEFSTQTQFLKVIEEKKYRRLGDVKIRKSDFRLICATNRNLQEDSDAGRFRKDLYYRIFLFPIQLPPLRERLEDLPDLIRQLGLQLGSNSLEVPDSVMKSFLSYSWPGNIRELKNVLERAMLLSRRGALEPQHFPDWIKQNTTSVPDGKDSSAQQIILDALKQSEAGLTRTEISALFANHKSAQEISRLLLFMNEQGLIDQDKRATGGRPVELWLAKR